MSYITEQFNGDTPPDTLVVCEHTQNVWYKVWHIDLELPSQCYNDLFDNINESRLHRAISCPELSDHSEYLFQIVSDMDFDDCYHLSQLLQKEL
jgi:hypothetical protein